MRYLFSETRRENQIFRRLFKETLKAMQFTTRKKTNPRNPAEVKHYPCPVYSGRMNLSELAERISDATSFTAADVYGILKVFSFMIPGSLALGEIVDLEGFGTLRLSFSGTGHEQSGDVTARDIRNIRIIFTPTIEIRRRLRKTKIRRKK